MPKRISILSSDFKHNQLHLETNISIYTLQPAGQILVDSDHLSFIYIMEDNEDYTYIILPEQLWPAIKTAHEHKSSVWLIFGEEQRELANFYEELQFVLSNIKGNSNYGDEMVIKVEHFFNI
jgi:hypothetical protein